MRKVVRFFQKYLYVIKVQFTQGGIFFMNHFLSLRSKHLFFIFIPVAAQGKKTAQQKYLYVITVKFAQGSIFHEKQEG